MLQEIDKDWKFSFGSNWLDFLRKNHDQMRLDTSIKEATKDILHWLSHKQIEGKHIIDIGCGSGLNALCFSRLNPKEIVAFDVDEKCIEATEWLMSKHDHPNNITLKQGSILDNKFVRSLGKFDIVYSWGVLHHTGQMWQAIEAANSMVKKRGLLWMALYAKSNQYPKDLARKQAFVDADETVKQHMIQEEIDSRKRHCERKGIDPEQWNRIRARGMDVYHDIIDWLAGLPYEVASVDEIRQFSEQNDLKLRSYKEKRAGANSIYLMQKL